MKKKSRKPKTTVGAPAALLAAAIRAQGDGVVVAQMGTNPLELKIIFANDAFLQMTGHTLAELAARTQCALHADKADLAKFDRWQKTAKPGRLFSGEGHLLRKNGAMLYAAWSFSVIVNHRRRRTHLVATYRDTTEKRSLQEALVHAQRLDAVGRLAGGVAHDFNNLLSVINGYCEMLAAQVTEMPRSLHAVTEIHQAGRKVAALTRQLLAFGRRQPMDVHVINFNQIIRENADVLTRLLGGTGQLVLELGENLGNVRTDPAQFQQVLLNLTINARDALRGDGRIIISTSNREIRLGQNRRLTDTPPGRYVVLTVEDNGTGMDAETQQHLFEPFFTTKPEGQGTGLGLALVYGVVQQSGGFIKIRSELLVGSTFEILLPEQKAPVEVTATPVTAPPLPVTRGHESVLVVEDDEVLRKMVAGMLAADGYRVMDRKKAGPLRGKGRVLPDKPIQLLIANLAGDGEKLARALHAARTDLRVLNVCNQGAQHTLTWLPREHQVALPKPFALSELLKAARKLLDA
ncbi:MAG: PAS domain S-box protein [Opitutaceae bacterium]|nr:PAS domain S-box protein [Opitutaceae bacterium]